METLKKDVRDSLHHSFTRRPEEDPLASFPLPDNFHPPWRKPRVGNGYHAWVRLPLLDTLSVDVVFVEIKNFAVLVHVYVFALGNFSDQLASAESRNISIFRH